MADVKKQIFLWFGDNDFAIHEQIRFWIDAFSKKHGALNIARFDALEITSNKDELSRQIKNALQVNSLFGMNKLVVFKDFLPTKIERRKSKIDADILQYIADSFGKLSETFFIVFTQTEMPATTSAIFKTLQKLEKEGQVEIQEFVLPKSRDLTFWVVQRVKKLRCDIKTDAAEYLCAIVGADLWQMANEIAKLGNYCSGQTIEKSDVKLLVRAGGQENIFKLLDAISARDKCAAAKLFDQQLADGAEEMYLFFMIAKQVRQLLEAKLMIENNPQVTADVLSQQMKLHPFVAKKMLQQAQNFDLKKLKEIYSRLAGIDVDLKTKNISFELLFEVLLSEI
ncbi:DNA polymerase III subunit delta [Candidatus Falkowbacteria bacterium]|nr:DNA polymerase III subunit delta [Candidatus Falkowbacteria bacterium]